MDTTNQKTEVKIFDANTSEPLGNFQINWSKSVKGNDISIDIPDQPIDIEVLYEAFWNFKTIMLQNIKPLMGECFSSVEPKTLFLQKDKSGQYSAVVSFK